MIPSTTFDSSLPTLIESLLENLPRKYIEDSIFLRDASGRLTFVVNDGLTSAEERATLSERASAACAPYVDADGFGVATAGELFDDTLVGPGVGWPQTVAVGDASYSIRLVDRRVAGIDWLQLPRETADVPRLVFSSLKGGVGRSTALCVAASALAAAGTRVLVVDMDVEAPGLGSMLLTSSTMPRLGLLDFLVEANLGSKAEDLLSEVIAPSWLAAGDGIVDVLPALGSLSKYYPENVLSKIARAYVGSPDSQSDGVSERVRELLNAASSTGRYDAILIDARAGLHETTGAAILGLGGHVLLFGIDQPQTFDAYDLLMANLGVLKAGGWDNTISVVQAKADADLEAQGDFAAKFRQLLVTRLSSEADVSGQNPIDLVALRSVFDVDWASDGSEVDTVLDEGGEAFAVCHILESEMFRAFDPLTAPDRLSPAVYDAVFGSFLRVVFQVLGQVKTETLDV